ncbi:MAG: hypothetical protein ABFR33_03435 [Verrucomicrobiota bacterium]
MKGLMKGFLSAAILASVMATSVYATFPLRVDIDVSTKRHKKSIGAGDAGEAKVEQVQCRVKIRKAGGSPYADQLTAELYVIGQQIHTGYFGIIDVVKKDFTFTKENDNTFEFLSKMYALGATSGNINVGGKYETYLLVVVDKDGKIIETRSGRVIRERGVSLIREMGPRTLFDRDGNVVGKVENKGEAFRAAVPAATSVDNYDD